MKKTLILILIFFCYYSIHAQTGWIQQPLSTSAHFLKIEFINSQTGFITGGTNKILRTSNSGNNWEEISTVQFISEIRDFHFVNQTTGFAVGTYTCCYPQFQTYEPVILKTTNSGISWNEIYRENNPANPKILTSIRFVNQLTGYVSAGYSAFGNNYILKTTDGGNIWSEFSNIQVNQFPFDIYFIDESNGISTLYSYLMKTDNGGLNWSLAYGIHYNFYSIFFLNNSTGYATGGDLNYGGNGRSIILKTTNSGGNWFEALNLYGRKFNLLNSVHFPSDNVGYSVGTYYPGYPDADNVSLIFKSTDAGMTWGTQNPNVIPRSLISVYFLDDNTGFIVGKNSTLLKTTNGGGLVVNVDPVVSNQIPNSFALYQNYPNPFNPVTNLGFGISNLGFVSLKVYDITGKEVATLVNEKLSPGSYEVEFDGSNFSSGIYFYKIIIDNFSEVKRMILLK